MGTKDYSPAHDFVHTCAVIFTASLVLYAVFMMHSATANL